MWGRKRQHFPGQVPPHLTSSTHFLVFRLWERHTGYKVRQSNKKVRGPGNLPSLPDAGHMEPGCSPPAHQAGVRLHQKVRHISASEVLDHLPKASHSLGWRRTPSSSWAIWQQAAGSRLAALAGWGWRFWSPVAAGQDAGHIWRDLRDREVASQGVCTFRSPVESRRAVGARQVQMRRGSHAHQSPRGTEARGHGGKLRQTMGVTRQSSRGIEDRESLRGN